LKSIRVSLKDRSYNILIGRGTLKGCGHILRRLKIGRDAIVITSKPLFNLYGNTLKDSLRKGRLTSTFELVPDSERAKSYKVAISVLNRISSYDTKKQVFIIALGGGVIGDLAGFIAAIYKRGTPYVQIPTTLLAQVDSAIGGKVAINLEVAKNLVGAFYQPRIVLSDISLIRTLSKRQIRNGLAEIIKYGVVRDPRLFEFLENNCEKILALEPKSLEFIISRSSAIKATVVEDDEFDIKGLRAILNYGHTIGHAVEAASGYSKQYHHGEALAIGMVVASHIASTLGLIKLNDAQRLEKLIERVGLPTKIAGLKFNDIYEAHLHDKKFIRGRNRLVLPTRIGSVKLVQDVPDSLIRAAIKKNLRNA